MPAQFHEAIVPIFESMGGEPIAIQQEGEKVFLDKDAFSLFALQMRLMAVDQQSCDGA